jgi:hypothetical protein
MRPRSRPRYGAGFRTDPRVTRCGRKFYGPVNSLHWDFTLQNDCRRLANQRREFLHILRLQACIRTGNHDDAILAGVLDADRREPSGCIVNDSKLIALHLPIVKAIPYPAAEGVSANAAHEMRGRATGGGCDRWLAPLPPSVMNDR